MKIFRKNKQATKSLHRQAGLTLIELMIAMTVLAIGLAGIMTIVVAALYSDSRNHTDTSATLLSQMVIEQMATVPASSSPVLTVTDCGGTTWNINTAVGGAALKGTNNSPVWVANDIDFNVASAAGAAPGNGYAMMYQTCGTNGSVGLTYDVRWNIRAPSAFTKRVVVASKIHGNGATTAGGAQNIFFSIPVQLKTILGS